MNNQQKVWNAIAEEWHEFKEKPTLKTIDFVKNQKGKLLEIGCGSGRNFVKTSAEIYAVDFSKEMIKFAKQKAKELGIDKIKFFVETADNLTFENEFFDAVVCTHVLYCIPDKKSREKAVHEIYRVMKPNAKILFSVWNKNSKRFKKSPKEIFIKWTDKGKRYYYLFEEKEIHDLFKKAGFKIIDKINSEVNITFIAQK